MSLDVLLDETTGDLARVTRMIDDTDPDTDTARRATAQRIRRRMLTLAGTWILDGSVGLPYLRWMESKQDLPTMLLLVRREIEEVRRVLRTEQCTITHDRTLRKVTITMTIILDNGDPIALSLLPFGVLGNPTPAVLAE